MWFIFPQLAGLGRSSTARFYGIASLAEARAYLTHPVLGARLKESVAAVLCTPAPSLHALFGSPDDLKFKASMTLFDAAQTDSHFSKALARWCGGERDLETLRMLSEAQG